MSMHRIVGLALAATIAGTGLASATTYAAPEPPQEEGYPLPREEFEQAYVTKNVNVRSEPSTNARVVGRLKEGNFVNVGECQANWCFVDAHGGTGWVLGRFIGRGENPYSPNRPAE